MFLKYLEDKGKSIHDATAMDVKVYLAARTRNQQDTVLRQQ